MTVAEQNRASHRDWVIKFDVFKDRGSRKFSVEIEITYVHRYYTVVMNNVLLSRFTDPNSGHHSGEKPLIVVLFTRQ